MSILIRLVLIVSFSVSAQVLEPQHRTQNWFSAWTALGSSVQAVLPLVFLNRYDEPLLRLKRIQELMVHIAESTSSVAQQQKKEELRTQLSLLDARPDSEEEEEEQEKAQIILEFVPAALLPPMHQLPSSTGAAPEGGNPGDPNPAPIPGGPQQLPAFNATQRLERLLYRQHYKLEAIKDDPHPGEGQIILSGIQGYGPQIQ